MSALGIASSMDGLFRAAAETAAISSAMRRQAADGANAVSRVAYALQVERQAHARTRAALQSAQQQAAAERARADAAEALLRQLAQAGVI